MKIEGTIQINKDWAGTIDWGNGHSSSFDGVSNSALKALGITGKISSHTSGHSFKKVQEFAVQAGGMLIHNPDLAQE